MIKQIEKKINKAEELYKQGDYNSAKKLCIQILKIDSLHSHALTMLGNISFLQHDYHQALSYYQKIEQNFPLNSVNLLNLSNVYFEQNDFVQAQKYAEQMLSIHPSDVTALSLLGNSLMARENYDSALDTFYTLLEYKPNDCWTLNSLSQIYQKKGDIDKAFEYAYAAVKNSCGDDAQQLNLGYLLYETSMEKGFDSIRDKVALWKKNYGELPQVSYMINALENNQKIEKTELSYLQNVFDNFAQGFEQVLSGLEYAAPQYISEYMQEIYPSLPWKKLRILDVGCGTGLCGIFLKKYASWRGLDGVDISAGMLAQAQNKNIYSHLYNQELCVFLSGVKNRYDLITAADVFTYFGNLENVIREGAQALRKTGRIIFTITQNSGVDTDWFLHASGRFAHSFSYVEKLLKTYGFVIEKSDLKQLRLENDSPVMGYVISAHKI